VLGSSATVTRSRIGDSSEASFSSCVRLSMAGERLWEEAARYAAIPADAANFARMGLKPVETAVAAESPDAIKRTFEKCRWPVDQVVIRATTAKDTVEEPVALVRPAAPASTASTAMRVSHEGR
jgi:hypothetical protein